MSLQDPERSSARLHATPAAVREARLAVRDIEPLRRFPDVQFTVELLTAELVSNVLRHSGIPAGSEFELLLDCDAACARIEVVNPGPQFNPLSLLRVHDLSSDHHRGIALVNALADRWGYRTSPGECSVWFEIDLIPGRRPWRGREQRRSRTST